MVLEALTELQATVATQQNLLVTDYLRREDADVLYAPMDTDGGGTGATTGGLTKTEADTYYAPITDSTVYATKTEVLSGLEGKSNTGHTHTEYALTTHNHDGTYLKQSQADTLYAPISATGGGSTASHLAAQYGQGDVTTIPANTTFVVPWNVPGAQTDVYGTNGSILVNTTPLVLQSDGWWKNTGSTGVLCIVTWQLSSHTTNGYKQTWLSWKSNTLGPTPGVGCVTEDVSNVVAIQHVLSTSTVIRLQPGEQFAILLRFGVTATFRETYSGGGEGVTMMVACFTL